MKTLRLLMFMAMAVIGLSSCSENYSNGERIGLVTQFSRSGLIFKSWEGHLNVTQTGMNSSVPFDFSIDNNKEEDRTKVIATLDSAAKHGWKVRLVYHEVKMKNMTGSRGDTNHFVDTVEVMDKNMSILFNNNTPQTRSGHVIDTIYVVLDQSKIK